MNPYVLTDKVNALLDQLQALLSHKANAIDSIVMFFDCLPLPAWVKDLDGKIIMVNRSYQENYNTNMISESLIKVEMSNYILNQYAVNDLWVINYKKPRVFIENAPKNNDPDRKITALKFPVFSQTGDLSGTGGVELPPLQESFING